MTRFLPTEGDKKEFRRIRNKVDSIKGPGVKNTPNAISISTQPGSRGHGGGSVGEVWVKVVSNATGGGKYYGFLMSATIATSVSATANYTEAELGVVGTTSILICNNAEIALSTHKLTAGTPVIKYFLATKQPIQSNEATPKDVYVITAIDVQVCT